MAIATDFVPEHCVHLPDAFCPPCFTSILAELRTALATAERERREVLNQLAPPDVLGQESDAGIVAARVAGELSGLRECLRVLEAERDRLREALGWYANRRHWCHTLEEIVADDDCEAQRDGGQRAREALSPPPPAPDGVCRHCGTPRRNDGIACCDASLKAFTESTKEPAPAPGPVVCKHGRTVCAIDPVGEIGQRYWTHTDDATECEPAAPVCKRCGGLIRNVADLRRELGMTVRDGDDRMWNHRFSITDVGDTHVAEPATPEAGKE